MQKGEGLVVVFFSYLTLRRVTMETRVQRLVVLGERETKQTEVRS